MIIDTAEVIILIIGIIIGIFCAYVQIKLAILEQEIKKFPSPMDLAREIVKIKLPLTELPPDVQEQIKMENKILHPPQSPSLTPERPTYVG